MEKYIECTTQALAKFNQGLAPQEILCVGKYNGRQYIRIADRAEFNLWQRLLSVFGWSSFNLKNILHVSNEVFKDHLKATRHNWLKKDTHTPCFNEFKSKIIEKIEHHKYCFSATRIHMMKQAQSLYEVSKKPKKEEKPKGIKYVEETLTTDLGRYLQYSAADRAFLRLTISSDGTEAVYDHKIAQLPRDALEASRVIREAARSIAESDEVKQHIAGSNSSGLQLQFTGLLKNNTKDEVYEVESTVRSNNEIALSHSTYERWQNLDQVYDKDLRNFFAPEI